MKSDSVLLLRSNDIIATIRHSQYYCPITFSLVRLRIKVNAKN